MGIPTDSQLDDFDEEDSFRRLLHSFGEPAAVVPPPDLVVRTARRIPQQRPQAVFHRQRRRSLTLIVLVLVLILLAAIAMFSQYSGPSTVPFGSGEVGLGRVFLISQLALKPLLGTISSLSLFLFGVGLAAIAGSMAILRFAPQTATSPVSGKG